MKNLKDQNAPQRKYLRKEIANLDRQVKIQSTLLEYGQQNILLSNISNKQRQANNSSSKTTVKQTQEQKKLVQSNEEEENLKKLINEMSEADKKQVNNLFHSQKIKIS